MITLNTYQAAALLHECVDTPVTVVVESYEDGVGMGESVKKAAKQLHINCTFTAGGKIELDGHQPLKIITLSGIARSIMQIEGAVILCLPTLDACCFQSGTKLRHLRDVCDLCYDD